MRYLSVSSGVDVATLAWRPLGFEAVAFSEIDPFPCALLKHHYPNVPNWGDMNNYKDWPDANVDILVGGTPCQDFSVAGLRAGIAAPRGNLALVYLTIADRYRPRWLVWENVPGVRSSGDGRDFGTFLGGLGELGYGWAYRSLDAQYFNLAQRRERVFVVGCLGGWRRAAAVLFESESLRGDPAPSRAPREDIAAAITESPRGDRGTDAGRLIAGTLNANTGRQQVDATYIARPLLTHHGRQDGESDTFVAVTAPTLGASSSSGRSYGSRPISDALIAAPLTAGDNANSNAAGRRREDDVNLVYVQPLADPLVAGEQRTYTHEGENNFRTRNVMAFKASHFTRGKGGSPSEVAPPLTADADKGDQDTLIAFDTTQITHPENRANPQHGDPCHPLAAKGHPPAIAFSTSSLDSPRDDGLTPPLKANQTDQRGAGASVFASTGAGVRRLTPTECERLMGIPDGYTLIPYNGKPAKDSPRYKAIGNSFPRPVLAWIGARIKRFT